MAPLALRSSRAYTAATRPVLAVKREVSSFQHEDGRTSLLKHIIGGGALMEQAEMTKGVTTSVRQKELWPLIASMAVAVSICAYQVYRMNFNSPDTMWNKQHRMAEIQDKDRLEKESKSWAAHKASKEMKDQNDIKNISLLGLQPQYKGTDPRHQ